MLRVKYKKSDHSAENLMTQAEKIDTDFFFNVPHVDNFVYLQKIFNKFSGFLWQK